MGISLGTNFELLAQKFLDSRQSFDTLADMKAFSETSLPDGFLTYNKEDKQIYQFDSSNTEDITTGKWTVFASGGNDIIIPSTEPTNKVVGSVWLI